MRYALVLALASFTLMACEGAAEDQRTVTILDDWTTTDWQNSTQPQGAILGFSADSVIQWIDECHAPVFFDDRPGGTADCSQTWYFVKAGSNTKPDGSAFVDGEEICKRVHTWTLEAIPGFDPKTERMLGTLTCKQEGTTCGECAPAEQWVIAMHQESHVWPGDFGWWQILAASEATAEVPAPFWAGQASSIFPMIYCPDSEKLAGRSYCAPVGCPACSTTGTFCVAPEALPEECVYE